ncbi:hypothetical protein GCM10009608_70460 [Pseudonocardia alaniniphila]
MAYGTASMCHTPHLVRGRRDVGIVMLNRAHQAGVPTGSSWASADEAYGQNPAFRD